MGRCTYCGTFIVFGGVSEAGQRFCGDECRDSSVFIVASADLPEEFVAERARAVQAGACPKCGGRGPVDVHTSHTAWSALIVTTWNSKPEVCCQSCGTKARLKAIGFSSLLGWWGMPWGLLATPIQILRNAGGLLTTRQADEPSEDLVRLVRLQLTEQLVEEDRRARASEPRGTAAVSQGFES